MATVDVLSVKALDGDRKVAEDIVAIDKQNRKWDACVKATKRGWLG